MSLVIDTNMSYIQSKLGLSVNQLELYTAKGMSVDEIIQEEATQGNQAAVSLAHELMTNVNLVIELFHLADPNNKYAILSEMTAAQMSVFLPQMEEKDMIQGLSFFTEDKLMKMLEEIPIEQLVKTVFQMFSQEEVVKLMPDEQLNKFLESTDIDKNKMLEHLKSIPPEYLAQMLERVTGQAVQDFDSINMVKQIGEFNPLQYKDALTGMDPTQKKQLVLSLAKENPEWFQNFDAAAYTQIIDTQKQKPEVIKAMSVIEPEEIIKMLKELPNDLLSIVITQIDTEVFADNLMEKFPQLMAQILAR